MREVLPEQQPPGSIPHNKKAPAALSWQVLFSSAKTLKTNG
jgi:hypothetical protein